MASINSSKNNTGTKVVTGKVRLSYVNLFEPRASDDDETPKYSCVVLIPKSDTATLEKLRAAQEAALEKGKGKFDGKVPAKWHSTIRDGDDPEEADIERNPEYVGHMFMNVSSKTRPGIVDAQVAPILDRTELYSGVYARVSLGAFAYNYKGKKGVSFGLNHVQKIADGEPLGGATSAESDFDAYDDEDSYI